MKISKTTSLIAIAIVSLSFAGCRGGHRVPDRKTFLGIVEVEKGTYSPTTPLSFDVSTDEIVDRDNYSGDRVKLFWGLISFED